MQKSAFDTKYGVISKFIRVELKKETKNRKIQTHTQLAIRCINPDIPRGFTPQLLSGSCPAHQLTLMNSRNNYTRMTNNTIRRQIFRNTYISMSYIHSRVRHSFNNTYKQEPSPVTSTKLWDYIKSLKCDIFHSDVLICEQLFSLHHLFGKNKMSQNTEIPHNTSDK